MADHEELAKSLAFRAALYSWLSRLYKTEVNPQLLSRLKSAHFPGNCGNAGLQAAYDRFQASLAEINPVDLDDLAADFARCFLGAGIAKGSEAAAFPYASVYTDPQRIVMQQARDRAVAAYNACGLQVNNQPDNLPEDHLAYLLEFMAVLCRQAQPAASSGEQVIHGYLTQQFQFLQEHLLNWVAAFCDDLNRQAQTPFYQSIAQITLCWLELDCQCLASLTA